MHSLDWETTCASDPLTSLCQKIIAAHLDHWPPGEAAIAEEFVSAHPFQAFASTEDLSQLSLRLRIEMSVGPLPESLRGYNCAYGNRKTILIAEKQSFVGATEHTFLHEIREILEYIFTDHGFPTTNNEDLEHRAEEFARLVRMVATQRSLTGFLEIMPEITSKWGTLVVFGLIVVGTLVQLLGCALLPQLERMADVQSHSRACVRA
jgi:hypothetical protein